VYQKEREKQITWLLCVIFLHAIFLFFLFFSYVTQPLLQHRKLSFMNFKVPAPVIFYGTHITPHARPGGMQMQSREILATEKLDIQKNSVADQKQPVINKLQDGLAYKKAYKEHKPIEKKHVQQTSLHKIQENKKPTLADLFNHARTTFSQQQKAVSNLQQDGDGAGQPLIIKEGDIRYYNLWKTFLMHLNDHARFNRARKATQVGQWIQEKKIKNNLQCAITINKKGEVLLVEIMLSSGHQPFDALCLDDIWSASPFPPLPDHLHKQTACFEVKSYF